MMNIIMLLDNIFAGIITAVAIVMLVLFLLKLIFKYKKYGYASVLMIFCLFDIVLCGGFITCPKWVVTLFMVLTLMVTICISANCKEKKEGASNDE